MMGMRKHGQHPGHIVGPDGSVLYVHIPRTGGQSVCRVFGCTDGHLPVAVSKAMLKDKFDACARTIAVSRNPWDHAVSVYLYGQGYGDPNNHQGDVDGFRAWVAGGCRGRDIVQHGILTDSLDQVAYMTGPQIMVFRFPEGIDKAIDEIAKRTGLPRKGTPHAGRATRLASYVPYYDDASIKTVADMRQKEITMFGWKFGA